MGLLLRSDLLFLALACIKAIDPISVILRISIMFTILNGLEILSRPSITHESLSFFGTLKCFGVNSKLFMLKSYCETSEMESSVRTLVDRYSDPIYISLE